jgi:hypothetical protein
MLNASADVASVIGLALSLPFTTDLGSRWIVNAGVPDA